MLRGLFAAISQANFTENYTVFRSMGSPTFQSKYSAEQLKTNSSGVRKLKVDFTQTLTTEPEIVATLGKISDTQAINLMGYFPTEHHKIEFNITYQAIDNIWRMETFEIDAKKIK